MLVTLFLILLIWSLIATTIVLAFTNSPDDYIGLAWAGGPISLAGILLTTMAGQYSIDNSCLLLLLAIFFPPFAASAYTMLHHYVLEPLTWWNISRLEQKYGKAPMRAVYTTPEADLPTTTGSLEQVVAELQRNLDELEKKSGN